MADDHDIQVRRNPDGSAYELSLDGAVVGRAFLRHEDGAAVFTHTEIDDAVGGQHLGSRLAEAALDDVRARGEAVVPLCPFIAGWIDRHPAYQDLVA